MLLAIWSDKAPIKHQKQVFAALAAKPKDGAIAVCQLKVRRWGINFYLWHKFSFTSIKKRAAIEPPSPR